MPVPRAHPERSDRTLIAIEVEQRIVRHSVAIDRSTWPREPRWERFASEIERRAMDVLSRADPADEHGRQGEATSVDR